MEGDAAEDVLAANAAFYAAHESGDLEMMRAVWNHGDDVVCVHPGWPILRGWEMVEESWRRIFGGPGQNQFILTNQSVHVVGGAAWVVNDENLMSDGSTGTVAATNGFRLMQGEWKLVLHHGSPVMG